MTIVLREWDFGRKNKAMTMAEVAKKAGVIRRFIARRIRPARLRCPPKAESWLFIY